MSSPSMPDWVPGSGSGGRAGRANLNRVAPSADERQVSVTATGAVVPLAYGAVRCAARVFVPPAQAGQYLVIGAAWSLGPVGGVDGLYVDGEPASADVLATHYTGEGGQAVDAVLAAALGQEYGDDLVWQAGGEQVGACYSVVRIPMRSLSGWPQLTAAVRGMRVYDPRDPNQFRGDRSTWAFSDNPALVLADFVASRAYGMGRNVDWGSVSEAAEACDEVPPGDSGPRRRIALTLDRAQQPSAWLEALRTYAGVYVTQWGGKVRLVPDRPTPSVAVLSDRHSDGSPDCIGDLRIALRPRRQTPTVVVVEYTDPDTGNYATAPALAELDGVADGSVERRESRVQLPGIVSAAQAQREAEERLNYATLVNLDLEWLASDEMLAYEPGDVVTWSHSLGLADYPVRLLQVDPAGPGRWRCRAETYSDAVYSDTLAGPTAGAVPGLPDPFSVPAIGGTVEIVEDTRQTQPGTYASRLRVSWSAPAEYPYAVEYQLQVLDKAGDVVWDSPVIVPPAVTAYLTEGERYVVRVRARNPNIGATGAWGEQEYEVQGKLLPPGDVPLVVAYQSAADEVTAAWQAAEDVDIWRYLVVYGPAGTPWSDDVLFERVDGLRTTIKGLAPGDYDVLVRAEDSVQNQSPNVTRTTVTVAPPRAPATLDAFEAGGSVRFSWPASTGGYLAADGATAKFVAGYQLSYGPLGGSVAEATVIDEVAALRLVTDTIPAGTWRCYVRAFDAAVERNYSEGYAHCDVVVTLDANAFLVGEHGYSAPSLTNMREYRLARTDAATARYLTDDGVPFGTRFGQTLAGYAQPLATYHGAQQSELLTEAWDLGVLVSANWSLEAGYASLSGAAGAVLELSADDSDTPAAGSWGAYTSPAKTTARHARIRVSSTGGTLQVTRPPLRVRCDAIAREETGEVITAASGRTTVPLEGAYVKAKSIHVQPVGSSALTAVVDAVLLGSWSNGLEPFEFGEWTATASNTLSADADAYSGTQSGLFASTHVNPGSGGVTAGSYIRMPDAWERAVAGRTITITVRAKRPAANASAEFAVAYSTNEVGNSGWARFSPTVEWAEYGFSWTPAQGVNWNGDYLGIWGDTSGSGGGVLIDQVTVSCADAPRSFDVYLFDQQSTQVSGPVKWTFKGV